MVLAEHFSNRTSGQRHIENLAPTPPKTNQKMQIGVRTNIPTGVVAVVVAAGVVAEGAVVIEEAAKDNDPPRIRIQIYPGKGRKRIKAVELIIIDDNRGLRKSRGEVACQGSSELCARKNLFLMLRNEGIGKLEMIFHGPTADNWTSRMSKQRLAIVWICMKMGIVASSQIQSYQLIVAFH